MEEVLGLAGAIVVTGAPSIVDRRTISLRGGRAPQALTKRARRVNRLVLTTYCQEAGISPDDYEVLCTIESTPRVLILPRDRPHGLATQAEAILTMEEALAFAEQGRRV